MFHEFWLPQEFEMHGVLQFVVAQPVKSVLFKDIYPAHGHNHPFVHGEFLLAHGVLTPLGNTTATCVLARVQIKGEAIHVVGDFFTPE